MPLHGLLEDRRFSSVLLSILAFSIVVLGANILILRGGGNPETLNSVADVIAALVVSIIALRVWASNYKTASLSTFWGLMALGLILWTIAESIWLVLGLGTSEIPFPSIADLFWLVGYVPFLIAFLLRDRQFSVKRTRSQRVITLLLAAFLTICIGYYGIWPTVRAFDPNHTISSLLSPVYPLADLFLLVLIVRIQFSVGTGRFSLTWQLLAAGFLLFAITDLMFSYADSIGQYYPGGHANLLSISFDIIYFNSYLVIAVGAFTFGLILEMDRGVQFADISAPLTRSSVLISVNKHDEIVSYSQNLLSLLNPKEKPGYQKRSLAEALGIDSSIITALHKRVTERGSVSNEALTVRSADGSSKDVRLTAFGILNADHHLKDIAIVLRANLDCAGGTQPRLTDEEQNAVEYYLSKAGTQASEERDILKTYFLEQIHLLVSVIRQFSGAKIAAGLEEYLNDFTWEKNEGVVIRGKEISFPPQFDTQAMGETLSTLLKAAATYASNAVSVGIIAEEMQKLDRGVKPDALRILDRFDLRVAETS